MVVEAAGNARAFETAFAITAVGGTTVTVGLPAPGATSTITPLDLTDLAIPEGVRVRWVHRAAQQDGERALVTGLANAAWPEDTAGVQAFVHGERETMKAARKELLDVRGLERSQVSLSGYWAAGRAEETFQAEKKLPVGKIL